MKRLLALFIALTLLLPTLSVFAAEKPTQAQPKRFTQADFESVTQDVWEDIYELESRTISAKRGKTATGSDFSALSEDVVALVLASDTYAEGSLRRNGGFISWRTEDGIACGYSPRLRERIRNASTTGADPETVSGIETVSYATKGGTTTATSVALIEPYYGLDDSFTKQYQNEVKTIAQATGGSYTVYKTTAASIDAIADAMETSAVVIFDSHGDTDYINPSDENDFVSEANTSYLCLQTGDGLTAEDMKDVSGTYGTYQHAYYGGSGGGGMKYYCVDGTAIANHMENDAPNNLLWMAICLGMATDGLQKPLHAKGVEVVYGYSQSVSFTYDYLWEAAFYSALCTGKTVAQSVAAMKTEVGNWDYCDDRDCNTIGKARDNYCAFPIVVSSEDAYPGKGNVDNLQTVASTWVLKANTNTHTPSAVAAKAATCTEAGNTAYWFCSHCSKYFADKACTQEITLASTVIAALGHSTTAIPAKAATCTEAGNTVYWQCTRCSKYFSDAAATQEITLASTVVAVLPHSTTAIAERAATCTETGNIACWQCTRCNKYFSDAAATQEITLASTAIAALGHSTTTIAAKAATCTEAGNSTYWQCTRCGKCFSDAAATQGITLASTVIPASICPGIQFTDMPAVDNWAHSGIEFALERELFRGISETIFDPNGNMTRAMLVTVLWRLDGEVAATAPCNFTDVGENQWFADAVAWAAEQEIVGGVGNGEFDPNGNVTREQIAAIMFRYAAKKGYNTTNTANLSGYPDYSAVSAWAEEALSWANAEELINGTNRDGITVLDPKGNATRAQVAAILMRYVRNIVE